MNIIKPVDTWKSEEEKKPYPICEELQRVLDGKVDPEGENDITIGDAENLIKHSSNVTKLAFNAYLFGYIRGMRAGKQDQKEG